MLKNTPLFAESWNVAFRKKETGAILTDRNTPFYIIEKVRVIIVCLKMLVTEGNH